jgi:THO complex subunit 3
MYSFNMIDNQCSLSKQGVDFKGHHDRIDDLAWHPTNDTIFVSASNDKTIKVWDSKTTQLTKTERTSQGNINLCFSPDGKTLAVSNVKEELIFYDFPNFKAIRSPLKFKFEINQFVWDKTGQAFFVADSSGNVSVFSLQS